MTKKTLAIRNKREKRFKLYGQLAIIITLLFLTLLMSSIISRGISGFKTTEIELKVSLDKSIIDFDSTNEDSIISKAPWRSIARKSIYSLVDESLNRKQKKQIAKLVTPSAQFYIRDYVLKNKEYIGQEITIKLPASSIVDQYLKGNIDASLPEDMRQLNNKQIGWINEFIDKNILKQVFNLNFFSRGDSRNAEEAGILGAMIGSALALIITLLVSFPLGVMASIYLEEFAPKNKITYLIEVNINNLAAVPSIVFGLLGLAIFLNVFGLPRSSPLAGGFVLALMTLPTIIISSRAAIKSVPPSIREAAMGLGASKMQSVLHHVLPLALPGMLTGTIIGMAQALGETAPLLMMGMVAFIVDVPSTFTDPSTVLPAQIFLWSDQPERGFEEKTAAAIMVLLSFLLTMNALAVFLRYKFERKW